MKFGIIGAGPIGTSIAKKLVSNGHEVKVADARGIAYLEEKEFVGTPVSAEEVVQFIDVLILALPLHVMPSIRTIVEKCDEGVIVVDTSNYYPFRDNRIEEIENGMVESVWVSNQLRLPIIKAFSNLLAYTLAHKGTPVGTTGRIAMAIAGDNVSQKQIIMDFVNQCGFDTVDAGSIADSWTFQPGTPAYCTELTQEELTEALQKANKDKAPMLRDKIMEHFSMEFTHEDIVNLNRKIYNL
ncbi:NADPH-dependent F420 reductase [Ureibacillus sp. GCM10028918]|uniref:NADPH-dependent F420 reductase n=1 Tax=Ureibacillus sp. GCM10028918 TaxID=3273429 RepID=UPI00361E9A8F